MIKIVDIGMNHNTAPVELRELLNFSADNLAVAIEAIMGIRGIKESIVLSTCNRIEIIFTTDNEKDAQESVIDFLSKHSGVQRDKLLSAMYIKTGSEAIRHIFRVSSSLDSMIVGEPQILGQVKDAYRDAVKHRAPSVMLNRLVHRCFYLAKKIRTETGISESAVSISFAAVELARKIFGDLHGKRAMLIGAGEMAELAATYLLNNSLDEILIANRTLSRAVELAEHLHGKSISLEEINDQLLGVDIVITSTGSTDPVITYENVKKVMKGRKNRSLFFIDIGVPRNVDPKVNKIENIFVYDIDDLKGIVEQNIENRRGEAAKAERIVDEEVLKFSQWIKTLDIVPTIVSLQDKCEIIWRNELKKTLSNLGDQPHDKVEYLENMARSITKKILNDPILFLKRKQDRKSRDTYLDFVRQLFSLDPDNGGEGSEVRDQEIGDRGQRPETRDQEG